MAHTRIPLAPEQYANTFRGAAQFALDSYLWWRAQLPADEFNAGACLAYGAIIYQITRVDLRLETAGTLEDAVRAVQATINRDLL